MIKKLNALKNQKGMTLVELLAVMVIIGIIAAISIPAIGNLMENSRKDAHISNAQALQEAARLYVNANEAEVAKVFNVQGASIVLTNTAINTWNSKVGEVDFPGDNFATYMESLVDPHTKAKYQEATVTITQKDTGGYNYAIVLKGPKCNISTSDSLNLTRAQVNSVSNGSGK